MGWSSRFATDLQGQLRLLFEAVVFDHNTRVLNTIIRQVLRRLLLVGMLESHMSPQHSLGREGFVTKVTFKDFTSTFMDGDSVIGQRRMVSK